jgi:hypothetical protein
MNALLEHYALHGHPLAISSSYCFTCGGDPCILPSFCDACRLVDFRNRQRLQSRPKGDLKAVALRANNLASFWTNGQMPEVDAVDKSYDFAVALGLLLYDGPTYEQAELLYNSRVDAIQHVLAAAFGRAS